MYNKGDIVYHKKYEYFETVCVLSEEHYKCVITTTGSLWLFDSIRLATPAEALQYTLDESIGKRSCQTK